MKAMQVLGARRGQPVTQVTDEELSDLQREGAIPRKPAYPGPGRLLKPGESWPPMGDGHVNPDRFSEAVAWVRRFPYG